MDRLVIFTRTVFASLIRRAREFGAVNKAQCGAVSFIQRFGSALNLNVHLHMLCIDGIFAADEDGRPRFQVLLAPEDEEIVRLTQCLAERIPKFLDRRGLGPDSDPEESDSLCRDEPWLAGLYAAAVSGKTAYGPNAGRRVTRVGDQIDPESTDFTLSPRCASVEGFSLHANVAVHAEDRERLERLVRYCARPPIAVERLERLTDDRLLYRFKRPWRDGTTHIVMEPLELIEKLSALVPAPKAHLVRYSGVLAPAAKWRALVVPESSSSAASSRSTHPEVSSDLGPIELPLIGTELNPDSNGAVAPIRHGRNYTWAELMNACGKSMF
jgi:hypothetical protein